MRKVKKVSLLLISILITSNLTGCSAVGIYYTLSEGIKLGFFGTDEMIDHNNMNGQLVEGVLSNSAKNKEREAVKKQNGEEDRNHDKLVQANGGISSSVDLDEEAYGDISSTKESKEKSDPSAILNRDFKKADFVNEDSYSIWSYIKYHVNEFKDYMRKEEASWSN